MNKLNDETLMAYVDGELSEEECVEVELSLANDPQALKKVERFRKTRAAIDKFADILSEPVPEHLTETVRSHERHAETREFPGRTWGGNRLRLAASLVIGISLGTIGTKYFLTQYYENEATIAASEIASLTKALEATKVEKEIAQEKAIAAEKIIAGISKDHEIAVAEKEAALAKAATTEAVEQKMARTKDVGKIFPLHLVDEALENGSKVSADLQKIILADLNVEPLPVSAVSDLSKPSAEPAGTIPLTGTVEIGSLKDLQPEKPHKKDKGTVEAGVIKPLGALGQSMKFINILGEFSFAGKSCRLFEYEGQLSSKKLVLVACKKGTKVWEIVQRQNRP